MRLPGRWFRRILIWPLPLVSMIVLLATAPLVLVGAAVASVVLPGRLRVFRVLGLVALYLTVEAAATVTALWLWVFSGFGWKLTSPTFQRAHYQVLRMVLAVVVALGRRLFSLDIAADGEDLPADDGDPTTHEAPLVVMSRHAGPADSILLVHEIMSWRGRQPRIVAMDLLQLDPIMDIYLNRLPNRFVSPDRTVEPRPVDAIAELASGMTASDAFVIFPEGANFTPRRRLRAIARLRREDRRAADRATKLRNVLPPRPAGTMAALAAAPDANAVFVAHTGLDDLASIGDLWRSIPVHKTVQLAWQVVPADQIPPTDEGREEMLFQAWEAIDAWIEARRPPKPDSADQLPVE